MRKPVNMTRRAALASATAALAAPALAQPPGIRTPGVYINEVDAFPVSVVGVATSVVAFVGPASSTAPRQPFEAFNEYRALHGRDAEPRFTLDPAGPREIGSTSLMERSVSWFYENGGGTAYTAGATSPDDPLTLQAMLDALSLAADLPVQLLVAPDAMRLTPKECIAFQQAMLALCAKLGDRFAILDVHPDLGNGAGPLAAATAFSEAIGADGAAFGAVYFPTIETSLARPYDFSLLEFDETAPLAKLLVEQDTAAGMDLRQTASLYDELAGFDLDAVRNGDLTLKAQGDLLNTKLRIVSPAYNAALKKVAGLRNRMPASPAVAGVYAQSDRLRGVWKAPASEVLTGAVAPTVSLDSQQSSFIGAPANKPAVNTIRAFPNRGTMIWGARTLDASDSENRYVNVRRTMIFLQSSIKPALWEHVFEPNDANTWSSVRAMVTNFLMGVWQQGGLVGSTPDEAFAVQCGLGATMTQRDIDDGRLIVTVMVAMLRPAEFDVMTFEIAMGER
jgi:hypothetical protein